MSDIPEFLALLPDDAAVGHLTTAVLQEREPLPAAALDRACTPLREEPRWAAEPLRELCNEAMTRFDDQRTAADAWLSPLLHSTLRITRREAADSRLWNHLALRVAPDYVFWRHPGRATDTVATVNRNRFSGPFYTQAFARLWWSAELFRDGYDYEPVVLACKNQDMLNTVLRLEVILHRPTAQAILKLLAGGTLKSGRDVNALAQAINAAGTTLVFEAIAPDAPQEMEYYRDWMADLESAHVPLDSLPEGPDDGRTPPASVRELVLLFERLFVQTARGAAAAQEGNR